MSMTILRKSIGINECKDLLNEPLMPQEFHVPDSDQSASSDDE